VPVLALDLDSEDTARAKKRETKSSALSCVNTQQGFLQKGAETKICGCPPLEHMYAPRQAATSFLHLLCVRLGTSGGARVILTSNRTSNHTVQLVVHATHCMC
jgi:hypothetical protein